MSAEKEYVVEVVGVQRLDFDTDKGDKIDGYNLYYTKKEPDNKNLKGLIAIKKFISKELYERIVATLPNFELVGYKGDFVYTDKGKINGIM